MDGAKPIHWGEVTLNGATVLDRCADAQRKMTAISKLFHYDTIVFESAAYVNNRKVVIDLAYVFGATVGALMQDGVRAVSVGAITWQSNIGNKVFSNAEKYALKQANPGKSLSWLKAEQRRQRKQRTIDWVKQTYGITVDSDNVADAFGVCAWGAVQ